MQGQADQNPPLLTWKKLTVQAFKQGTKTHGCLHTAGKIKTRSACCPECGARVRAHRRVPTLKRHAGGLAGVGVCVSGVRRVLLLLPVVCAGPDPSILGGKMPWQHLGFHFTSGASQEEALPGPAALSKTNATWSEGPWGLQHFSGHTKCGSRGRGSPRSGERLARLAGGGLCLSLSEGS